MWNESPLTKTDTCPNVCFFAFRLKGEFLMYIPQKFQGSGKIIPSMQIEADVFQ